MTLVRRSRAVACLATSAAFGAALLPAVALAGGRDRRPEGAADPPPAVVVAEATAADVSLPQGFAEVGGVLEATAGGVRARIDATGASLESAFAPGLGLHLGPVSARRGEAAIGLAPPHRGVRDDEGRATIDRGALREVYAPGADGVELRFELPAPLPGSGALLLGGAFRTGLEARAADGIPGLAFVLDDPDTHAPVLTLGGVRVIDALGAEIAGELRIEGDRYEIEVDGAWLDQAAYPVVVDPLVGSAISVSAAGQTPDIAHSVTSDQLLAVWIEAGQVRGRRFEKNGIPLGAAFVIESTTTNLTPSVAWLETGDQYLVAYERANAIFARRVSAAGVVSAEITVYDEVAAFGDDATRPVVGGRRGAAGGRWIIVFDLLLGGLPDHDIGFTLIDANGAIVTTLSGTQNTVNGAGTFFIFFSGGADEERFPSVNKLAPATQPWGVGWEGDYVTFAFPDFQPLACTIANDGTRAGATFFTFNGPSGPILGDDREVRIGGPGPNHPIVFLHTDPGTTAPQLWIRVEGTGTTFFTSFGTGAGFSDNTLSHANNSAIAAGELCVTAFEPGSGLFALRANATNSLPPLTFLETSGSTVIITPLGANGRFPGVAGRLSQAAGRHAIVTQDPSGILLRQYGELPAQQVEHPTGTALTSGIGRIEVGHFARGGAGGSTQVTIRNTGLGDLGVQTASITQVGGNPFAVAGAPLTIAQGQTGAVTLSYTPTATERTTAALNLASDVVGNFQVEISGRAADAAAAIDTASPPPIAVAGAGPTTTTVTLTAAIAGAIGAATVHVDLLHPALASLTLEVESPGGQRVTLAGAGALTGAHLVGTTFQDGGATLAGAAAPYTATFAPTAALAGLIGTPAGGAWKLHVTNAGAAAGVVQGFSIDVVLGAPAMVVRDGQGTQLAPGATQRLGLVALGTAAGAGPAAALRIDNPGTAPITIASAAIAPTGDFVTVNLTTPAVVPAVTGQLAFAVELLAQARGRRQATLNIDHDDPGVQDPFPVALRGIVADHVAAGGPVAIADPGLGASTISVATSGALAAARVHLDIVHPSAGQLEVTLVSPSGTRVPLVTRRGAGADLRDTTLDDAAATLLSAGQSPFDGAFRPESTLQVLAGEPIQGTWTLEVNDTLAGSAGSIRAWGLELDQLPPGQPGLAVADAGGRALITGAALFAGHAATGGGSRAVGFTVRNFGTGQLDLAVAAMAAPFSIAPSGAVSVAAGQTQAFTVTFAPSARGAAQAQAAFTHNAPNAPASFALATSAVGADAAAAIDPAAAPAIPDNLAAGLSASVPVSGAGAVTAVRVSLDARHEATGDLALEVVSPEGTRLPLSTRRGGTGDDYRGTSFSDAAATAIAAGAPPFAGAFRPETPLGALAGEPAAGTWSIVAKDLAAGSTGALLGASLELDLFTGRALRVREAAGPGIANGGLVAFSPRILFSPAIERALAFENHGGSATTLQRATVSGGSAGAFALDGPVGLAQQTLAAGGGSAELRVRFAPRALGLQLETVEVLHNAGNQQSPFRAVAVGRGVSGFFLPAAEVAIPDGVAQGLRRIASVPLTGEVDVVRVNVDVRHPAIGDLTLRLISPASTTITLVQNPTGAGSDLSGTSFADGAPAFSTGAPPHGGTFAPQAALAALAGEGAFGDWTLEVVDSAVGGAGALIGWSIEIETVPLPSVALRVDQHPAGAPVAAAFATPARVEVIDAQGLRAAVDGSTRITAAIQSGPTGGVLSGATTVTVTAGVATFADLAVSAPGTYLLAFTAPGLLSTVSLPFDAGAPTGGGGGVVVGSGRDDGGSSGGGGCQLAPTSDRRAGHLVLAALVGALAALRARVRRRSA